MEDKEIPSEKGLKKLPRWGRVAVVARALRRAMPLIAEMIDKDSKNILESIEFAIRQSENSAFEGTLSEHLLWSCNRLTTVAQSLDHSSDDRDDSDEDYAGEAIAAAYLLTLCCIKIDIELEIETLEAISNVVFHFECFKRRKALTRTADTMVIADFDRLRNACNKAELRIDSPVPATVLGDLWPESKPRGWPTTSKVNSASAKFRRPRSNRQAVSLLPTEVVPFLEQKPSSVIESPSLECGQIVLNKPEYLSITKHLFSMNMTDSADRDPADEYSVWLWFDDGSDVERLADSFEQWLEMATLSEDDEEEDDELGHRIIRGMRV